MRYKKFSWSCSTKGRSEVGERTRRRGKLFSSLHLQVVIHLWRISFRLVLFFPWGRQIDSVWCVHVEPDQKQQNRPRNMPNIHFSLLCWRRGNKCLDYKIRWYSYSCSSVLQAHTRGTSHKYVKLVDFFRYFFFIYFSLCEEKHERYEVFSSFASRVVSIIHLSHLSNELELTLVFKV